MPVALWLIAVSGLVVAACLLVMAVSVVRLTRPLIRYAKAAAKSLTAGIEHKHAGDEYLEELAITMGGRGPAAQQQAIASAPRILNNPNGAATAAPST